MIRVLLASVAVLSLASSAYAADMNAPAAPMGYVAPVPYSWTGLYIGADAGGAWAHSHGRWDPMDNLDKPDPAYFGEFPIDGPMTGNGFLAGGHIGADYQVHSWVVGVEADWMWTTAKASLDQTWVSTVSGLRPGAHSTLQTALDSIATFRGRAGYLVTPSLLLYATGGFALADADLTATSENEPTHVPRYIASMSSSKWIPGYVVGGGLEYAIQNGWSLRAEYLFYQLNTKDSTIAGDPSDATGNFCRVGCANPVFPSGFTRASTDLQAVRAGVSYKF